MYDGRIKHELPFQGLTDYDVEDEYIPTKRKILTLSDNPKFEEFLKTNQFDSLFNPSDLNCCKYYDEDEFNDLNRQGDGFLNVFSLNIRSLPKHGGELACYLNILKMQFDIIVMTEIGAKNINLMENLLENYTLYYITPKSNRCGGVGIYIRNKLQNVAIINDLSIVLSCTCQRCEIESLFIECMFHGIKYVIGGVYRHPNGNVSHFIQGLENTLNKIETKCRSVILGDMNIDIIKFSDDRDTLQYVTTMMSHKYLPYITMPTRLTPYSATCIDHIFMKIPDPILSPDIMYGILFCDISDHLPNFVSISHGHLNTSRENRPMTRIFSERNCANFVRKMETENWERLYHNDLQDWYSGFIGVIIRNYESTFPLVKVSKARWSDKPWLTKSLKISIKTKNKLYRRSTMNPGPEIVNRYRRYKNLLRICLKTAEIQYYNKLFENNKNSTFNLWKNLGTVINPKKCRKTTIIDKLFVNGKFVTDKQLISDGINNFFCNIGNSLQSAMIDKGDAYTKYLPPRLAQSFYLTPVDEEEIKREIKNMNPKKSPGHDSIGAKIIQLCPDIFAENLCKIYNRSIENECYPEALKAQSRLMGYQWCDISCEIQIIKIKIFYAS